MAMDINVKKNNILNLCHNNLKDGATQPWCQLAQQNLNEKEGENQKMQEEREKKNMKRKNSYKKREGRKIKMKNQEQYNQRIKCASINSSNIKKPLK